MRPGGASSAPRVPSRSRDGAGIDCACTDSHHLAHRCRSFGWSRVGMDRCLWSDCTVCLCPSFARISASYRESSGRKFISCGWRLVTDTSAGGVLCCESATARNLFRVKGVNILTDFYVRKRPDSSGMLLDGLFTIALAIMVWQRRPTGFLWVIAVLVGLCMLMGGITGFMAMAVRKHADSGGQVYYPDIDPHKR
jgi:hypothetical protein